MADDILTGTNGISLGLSLARMARGSAIVSGAPADKLTAHARAATFAMISHDADAVPELLGMPVVVDESIAPNFLRIEYQDGNAGITVIAALREGWEYGTE